MVLVDSYIVTLYGSRMSFPRFFGPNEVNSRRFFFILLLECLGSSNKKVVKYRGFRFESNRTEEVLTIQFTVVLGLKFFILLRLSD